MNIYGLNAVVYGAGASGQSAYGLLCAKGARAIVFDDNAEARHATDDERVFDNADLVVLSPGVGLDNPKVLECRLSGKVTVSELELASAFCKSEIIAVTGTNGKTTTVLLIDSILKECGIRSQALGNIGTPLSAVADNLDASDVAVVECSSFQLEGINKFAPDVAVILNVTPDHLERHKTMKNYISAKANITKNQTDCDVLVYNAEDVECRKIALNSHAKTIPFSTERPVDGAYLSGGLICYKGKIIAEIDDLPFAGREIENALAAVAVAMVKGVHPYVISKVLGCFRRPEFRRERVAKIKGVDVYNDSKATNVFSTLSAIEGVDGNTVLILGGAKRAEDFDVLIQSLDVKVKGIVAVGDNAEDIQSSAQKFSFANFEMTQSLDEAIEAGLKMCVDTGSVNLLFSPASKSYDHYSGYAERGRKFNAALDKVRFK